MKKRCSRIPSNIELNPVAAGIVEVPEASPHTSVTARVDQVKSRAKPPT